MNLLGAGKMPGVGRGHNSDSEMANETESESEDEATPIKKVSFTPVPQGTRSRRMFSAQAVEALLGEGEEAPILVHESEAEVFGAILTQSSLKQGLKAWGERAGESAKKKM